MVSYCFVSVSILDDDASRWHDRYGHVKSPSQLSQKFVKFENNLKVQLGFGNNGQSVKFSFLNRFMTAVETYLNNKTYMCV